MSTSTEAAKAKAGMTEYVVCLVVKGTDGSANYHVIGRVTATNASKAIRAKRNGDGMYVAIPARHLKPVTVKTTTVEKVELS